MGRRMLRFACLRIEPADAKTYGQLCIKTDWRIACAHDMQPVAVVLCDENLLELSGDHDDGGRPHLLALAVVPGAT